MKNELVFSTSEAKDCPRLTKINKILWPSLILSAPVFTLIIAYLLRDYPDYIGVKIFEYIIVGSLSICGAWLAVNAFIFWLHKLLWK